MMSLFEADEILGCGVFWFAFFPIDFLLVSQD